jgi:hypothetical protein
MIAELKFKKYMQNKNTLLAIIIILFIGLVISVGGWYKASNGTFGSKSDDAKLMEFENSLSVCDKTETLSEQTACTRKLQDLSQLLNKYEEKIRNINVQ